MYMRLKNGELAQLARAPALHAGGQGFESLILHHIVVNPLFCKGFYFLPTIYLLFFINYFKNLYSNVMNIDIINYLKQLNNSIMCHLITIIIVKLEK